MPAAEGRGRKQGGRRPRSLEGGNRGQAWQVGATHFGLSMGIRERRLTGDYGGGAVVRQVWVVR